ASLRGAIRFALGDYHDGVAELRRSLALDPAPAHAQRLALALSQIGQDDEALGLLGETEKVARGPQSLAWIEEQRAKIDLGHGRRHEARAHFDRALALFPGAWRVEAALAE